MGLRLLIVHLQCFFYYLKIQLFQRKVNSCFLLFSIRWRMQKRSKRNYICAIIEIRGTLSLFFICRIKNLEPATYILSLDPQLKLSLHIFLNLKSVSLLQLSSRIFFIRGSWIKLRPTALTFVN